jgi:hypothetical protein
MKYNRIKCWFIKTATFDRERLINTRPDLDLVKKSILKNGYRAFCLNERSEMENSEWYHNYMTGYRPLFYLDGSGLYKLVNIDLTDNELYFEKDNLPSGYRPWIFYSWQSDYNPSRSHVNQALNDIIAELNESRNSKAPLEIVQSTRPEDGAKNIVEAIKQNIDRSLISVFDITNVATVSTDDTDKSYPNANVVFELSYAIQRKREDQVILVRRRRDDLKGDNVPFDFQQLRHIAYNTAGEAKTQLDRTITQSLERMGFLT